MRSGVLLVGRLFIDSSLNYKGFTERPFGGRFGETRLFVGARFVDKVYSMRVC